MGLLMSWMHGHDIFYHIILLPLLASQNLSHSEEMS